MKMRSVVACFQPGTMCRMQASCMVKSQQLSMLPGLPPGCRKFRGHTSM